jgi:tetratricopeptide (TPR) repeat protein
VNRFKHSIAVVSFLVAALPLPAFAMTLDGTVNHAVQLFDRGRFHEAEVGLNDLQKREPGSAPVAYYLGRIALHQGHAEKAMRHLYRAVTLDGDNAAYHYWLGRAYGELAKNANLFKRPYYATKTKDEFEQALAVDPKFVYARVALVMYTLKAPGFLGGSRQEAEQNAAIVAKQNPVAGYRAYGLIDEQDKNYAHAQKLYEKAISEAPDHPRPYRWLAGVYRLQRKYDKAFQVYKDRISQPQSDWVARYDYASTALEAGQHLPQAEKLLRAYLLRGSAPEEPSVADAHRLLGELLKKQGKLKQAEREFRRSRQALNGRPDAEVALRAMHTPAYPKQR